MANQVCIDTCECENKSHFGSNPEVTPKHNYGHMVNSSNMTQVKTPYGTFNVCRDCKVDCHQRINNG